MKHGPTNRTQKIIWAILLIVAVHQSVHPVWTVLADAILSTHDATAKLQQITEPEGDWSYLSPAVQQARELLQAANVKRYSVAPGFETHENVLEFGEALLPIEWRSNQPFQIQRADQAIASTCQLISEGQHVRLVHCP